MRECRQRGDLQSWLFQVCEPDYLGYWSSPWVMVASCPGKSGRILSVCSQAVRSTGSGFSEGTRFLLYFRMDKTTLMAIGGAVTTESRGLELGGQEVHFCQGSNKDKHSPRPRPPLSFQFLASFADIGGKCQPLRQWKPYQLKRNWEDTTFTAPSSGMPNSSSHPWLTRVSWSVPPRLSLSSLFEFEYTGL